MTVRGRCVLGCRRNPRLIFRVVSRLSGHCAVSRKPDRRSAIRQSVPDGGLNALSTACWYR
ncbi:hypothetical protein KCP69_22430 [Salmonella enterica subsp. enterica]|nr:hypothetical protein KCP69_22430 [Salmonella enterica subsp. enterica]